MDFGPDFVPVMVGPTLLGFHKGSGSLLVRLYKDAGSPSTECSPTKFWKTLELLSMGRFTWFKKPALLIQTLPFRWNWYWKDLGHQNTLKFAQTLPLKSTIFTQLTENVFELHQISTPIQIFSCKNYFPWAVWIIWNTSALIVQSHDDRGVCRLIVKGM